MSKYTYIQSTGQILQDGKVIAQGYSGFGEGKNNPSLQGVVDIGPIPVGKYSINYIGYSDELGPMACKLMPSINNNTFGRNGFYIHGDSGIHPGLASHGCIIMPPGFRSELQVGDEIEVITYQPINIRVDDKIQLQEKVS